MNVRIVVIFLIFNYSVNGYRNFERGKMEEVFSWKQIGYDFDGVRYVNSSDFERNPSSFNFPQQLDDSERFFIQYNNVPIGMEVYGDRVFVTVPRRRYGIPSTLNYVHLGSSSPLLRPYPDSTLTRHLVSVYRPRADVCGRLWMVDTGLLEIPDERKQVKPPAIVVFDLNTNKLVLRYELKKSDLVNERSPGGLTSITVDVTPSTCDNAFAYINDLATEGLIVFSMAQRNSWRINDNSFKHDESAVNFTVAGFTINWKDGLFSIALSEPDACGNRVAYYHPLVSTYEFSISTEFLKKGDQNISTQILGNRGPLTQSGSHAYHPGSRTLLFANVAQDAILCWNVNTKLTPENVVIISQDHKKMVYISDLKIIGDDVWILVNQIPRFIYSTLNPNDYNYYIHRGNIRELIKGTACDRSHKG